MTENEELLPALVVEDDPQLVEIFTLSLKDAGFAVVSIMDGEEASRWLQTAVPALVVLDLHLPNASGGALLDQIRQDPRLANTKVVISTADPNWAETFEDEADLILIKPVSFRQLSVLTQRLKTTLLS